MTSRKATYNSKPKQTATRRPKQRRRGSSFKNPNWFVRFLSRIPAWILWLGGIVVGFLYVFFILQVVLHFSLPWKAKYGIVPEPDGYEVRGIDISHYQRSVNWSKLQDGELAGNKVSFVIMKATEGTTIFDKTFNDNFYQARKYSFIRGAYHCFIPGTSAKKQAEYFLSQVHLVPGDLPPVLDIEKSGGVSVAELRKEVREWLEIVGNHYGTKPIIYTYYSFKRDFLNTEEFNDYPFWIAHYYKDKLEYNGNWMMWQYTDCGRVDGVDGRVDCNVFNGTYEDLQGMCITKEQYPIDF